MVNSASGSGLLTMRHEPGGTITTRDRVGVLVDLVGFIAIHLIAIVGLAIVGFSVEGVVIAAGSYLIRLWGIAAGFHRYFSHHSYRLGRVSQFVVALLGTLAVQKGVLWWVSTHRRHHIHADTPLDPHSPHYRTFAYSHWKWMFDPANFSIEHDRVRDWARFPELVRLQRYTWIPVALYGALLWSVFGASGFVWGFAVSSIVLWHSVLATGSFSHRLGGYRNFDLRDDSRNNRLLAFILVGEGWHNNHHRAPSSARHGVDWREPDPIYWSLIGLQRLGIVSELRDTLPPRDC